jgi:hypothetical protein
VRKKRERTDRWLTMADDPATFREMCIFVIEGGTLVEWVRQHDVRYGDVSAWIAADDKRAERFESALKLRGEYLSDMVVRNLRQLVELDIATLIDDDGSVKPLDRMPAAARRAIAGIEVTEAFEGRGSRRKITGHTKKLKLVDPARAIELLGKYRRLFVEKIEHDASDSLVDLLTAAGSKPSE